MTSSIILGSIPFNLSSVGSSVLLDPEGFPPPNTDLVTAFIVTLQNNVEEQFFSLNLILNINEIICSGIICVIICLPHALFNSYIVEKLYSSQNNENNTELISIAACKTCKAFDHYHQEI